MTESIKGSTHRVGQLDELFTLAGRYRDGNEYRDLLDFVVRFRSYAPFNGMLVNVQLTGAQFVLPASRWMKDWRRRIKSGERPLVILQPMGPVMFVFDVSQTEETKESPPFPTALSSPFTSTGNFPEEVLLFAMENAKGDGVRIRRTKTGSQAAASICGVSAAGAQRLRTRIRPEEVWVDVPIAYDVLYSDALDAGARYAAIVHELAHLYLGHLGTPNPKWWPDRRSHGIQIEEFEAESVAWIVCRRLGVNPRSASYLAGYLGRAKQIPSINLELVLKVAGEIESMGRKRLPLRSVRNKT
ncbi:MAG: hypothetical protein ABIY52_03690 [Gemmatimonadaceae bacterium]